MVTMTTMLVSVAELSNIFSVLAVLVCFCAMILFITRNMMVIRVHDDDMMFPSLHQSVGPRIPQMKMMKVHIPFTFKIIETSKSTYAEVQVTVSSQVRYSFRAYWGVNIRELHVALWRPWAALRDSALDGTLLTGHYQQPGPIERRDPHVDRTLTLKLPAPPLALGTPPRLAYPLVIFLMRTAESPDSVHPDETVALVNVVHIKDTVCTLPTSVLAQYLKQANGQLSCLKQLYLATGNPVNYDDEHLQMQGSDAVQVTSAADHQPATAGGMALGEPMACAASHNGPTTLLCTSDDNGTVWNANGEQLCVVCQYFPLSRALLPCRHTCICASCFGKLDRCPMCRSPIKSYFCIRGEDYMPDCAAKGGNTTPKGLEPGSPLFNWFDSWNDRLTDFLGFQR